MNINSNNIFLLDNVIDFVNNCRKNKEIIGFTNGCFDILHLGHLNSLKEARSFCDRLIVGINSDESVRRLKGEKRPIQDIKTRSRLLSEFRCVDAVVIFDDDTALGIVRKIRPDVIAKEGYCIDNWPEAQYVSSYGGKIVYLTRIENTSTSNIENKILEKN